MFPMHRREKERVNITTILILGTFALAIRMFAIPDLSNPDGFTIARTVYFEGGNVVDPRVIVRTHDHGLIIAGSSSSVAQGGQGWAMKTDEEGNFKWRYVTSRRDSPRYGEITYGQIPEYRSAFVMADGSVFLCGFMPSMKNSSGILTHLDNDGKVLSEQLLYPSGSTEAEFHSCIAWNDGIAAVGSTYSVNVNKHLIQRDYWIMCLDYNSRAKWEKRVPISQTIGGSYSISPLQMKADETIVMVAERNTIGTEIFRISSNGDILAHKLLNNSFLLASSTHAESDIVLVSQSTDKTTRITLDGHLQEVERVIKAHEPGTVALAYRLPDRSLMLFGSWLPIEGGFCARIMNLDRMLDHERTLKPGSRGESFWIRAAVPLDEPGEFASARSATKPLKPGELYCRSTAAGVSCDEKKMAEARLGVAVDFVKMNTTLN